jgi:hypothetical protein
MKSIVKALAPCLAAVILGGAGTSHATIVTVDGSITAGFMAVFNYNGVDGPAAYQFGGNWAISAIKSTVGTSSIVLEANYNTYAENANDPYWRNNGGAGPGGNKWMVASSFAGVSASSFPDDICNFKAQVSAYTFTSGYTVRAFIKGFNADYSSNDIVFSDPLLAGSVVDLELDTSAWVNIQYGFEVQGLNANPAASPGSATVVATAAPPLVYGIPNPGFEIPNGAQWAFDQENGHSVLYPATGGNPGGYAEIDATQATLPYYGVLVSNGRLQLPLAALSLTAGQTYTFAMDMKVIAGTGIGGFKVDFIPSGTTGDMYPTPSGTPGEWSTYSFAVPIPATATGLKLVPLWGLASTVGYDNVRVAGPFTASATTLAADVKISWPTVTGRTYQVKKSNDLVNWAPFGASTNGNGSTFTVTDPVGAPGKSFFQVVETTP